MGQLAAEKDTTVPRRADTPTQEADEPDRQELPSPNVSTAEAEEDARAWAQVAEQGSSLLASAIGAPVAGASPASRNRHSELPGDDHWHEEPR